MRYGRHSQPLVTQQDHDSSRWPQLSRYYRSYHYQDPGAGGTDDRGKTTPEIRVKEKHSPSVPTICLSLKGNVIVLIFPFLATHLS